GCAPMASSDPLSKKGTPIMTKLSGKTALVTGASRGIGRASAITLGKAGAQVVLHYSRAAAEAEAVVAEIRDCGGRADKVSIDLSVPDGARSLAEQVRHIVGDRLDILVLNAGASKQRRSRTPRSKTSTSSSPSTSAPLS